MSRAKDFVDEWIEGLQATGESYSEGLADTLLTEAGNDGISVDELSAEVGDLNEYLKRALGV